MDRESIARIKFALLIALSVKDELRAVKYEEIAQDPENGAPQDLLDAVAYSEDLVEKLNKLSKL